jgi:hypothetical protein
VAAHFNTGKVLYMRKKTERIVLLIAQKEYFFFVLNKTKNWASFDKGESREIVGCSKLSFLVQRTFFGGLRFPYFVYLKGLDHEMD